MRSAREESGFRLAGIGVIFALAGLLIGGASSRAQEPSGLAAAVAIEAAMMKAIERCEKSVVAIARVRKDAEEDLSNLGMSGRMTVTTNRAQPGDPNFIPNEFGTGVVIDADGLILTNCHVLDLNSEHWITTPDRKSYRARIKGADPRSDLAVLEIDASDLTPIAFGDGAAVKKGQIVIALGNPYAIARDGQVSASWGIVSNIGRKVAPPEDESGSGESVKDKLYHFGTLIQTDARLSLGASGGALVNLQGEMIGLTTALAALSGYEQAAGFALPVDETFLRAVNELKAGKEVEYGFLGVAPKNLSPYDVRAGARGVRVDSVVRGTPAQRYDVRPEDVITHIDGQTVHDSDFLMLQVGKATVNSRVRLTVLRNERAMPINVELSKLAVRGQKVVTAPPPAWRGLRVDYATAHPDFQSRANLGEVVASGCVAIAEVEPGTPAAEAKLAPGMFISHAAGSSVRSPDEFDAAVAGKTGPVQLRLTLPLTENPLRTVRPRSG